MANKFRDIPVNTNALEQPVEKAEAIAKEKTKTIMPKNKPKGYVSKALGKMFSGTFLSNEKYLKHFPFVLFLVFVLILYIANGYYADNKIREENKLNNELKELRSAYISSTSDLMFASKQSEVAKAVEKIGLKEPVSPPFKITTDSNLISKKN
ncbi:MAG: hypothetical protein JSU07_07275 [Bacteroidetes bacterium]|nr:hypothetical protein [Bacteroidota bacterium]